MTLDGGSVGLDGRIDGKLSELNSKVGYLVEEQVAARIPKLFGEPYARYLLAESVADLGQLLPGELLPRYDGIDRGSTAQVLVEQDRFIEALGKKLLAEGVFSPLISNIQATAQVLLLVHSTSTCRQLLLSAFTAFSSFEPQAQGGEVVSLFKDDGEPSASAIGDYANQVQDEVTRQKLLRLQRLASCNSDEERLQVQVSVLDCKYW